MVLKKVISPLLIVLLLTTLIYSQNKNKIDNAGKKLVGQWETVPPKGERSKTIIMFNADGTLEYNIAAAIGGTYILNRNLLITYFRDQKSNTTEVDSSIVKIEGDTLYQTNLHRGEKILIKSVKLGKNTLGGGIIGKWLTQNFNGHKAIQEFSNDNLVSVDLIVRSITGTYTVSGYNLTLNLQGAFPIKCTFSLKKDTMTIIQPGKNGEKELVRVGNN